MVLCFPLMNYVRIFKFCAKFNCFVSFMCVCGQMTTRRAR